MPNHEDTKEEQHKEQVRGIQRDINIYTGLAAIFVLAGFIFGGWGVWIFRCRLAELNLLGDFLAGTTGILWSLAGLILIYIAFLGQKLQLVHQQEELALQREELKQTREELRGQREELALQNKTMGQQTFENSFFQLLEFHTKITTAIDEAGFKDLFNRFKDKYKNIVFGKGVADHEHISLGLMREAYRQFYVHATQATLGRYFRSLYNLVKFIDRSAIQDKTLYTNLLRAQLSGPELALLFYNGLNDVGSNFKPLIERYKLLKHLDMESLVFVESDKRFLYGVY